MAYRLKSLKYAVIKKLIEIRRAAHEQSDNFNKDRKYKNNQTETIKLKNTITELKISIERFNNRLSVRDFCI